MEVMKQLMLIALFIISLLSASAQAEDSSSIVKKLRSQGYSIKYIEDEVSIVELATALKEEKEDLYYLNLADYIEMLKRWNRHVKTFTNLEGEYVYTESPADPYLSYEYIPALPLNDREPQRRLASIFAPENTLVEENNLDYTELSARKYTFFAHVTVSQGNFVEEVNSSTLENQQNSPLTIGVGSHIRFSPTLAVASSVYLSKLNASTIDNSEIDQSELTIKDEVGGNLYLEYKMLDSGYSIYGGIDYEEFTTLNLDEIIEGSSNIIDTNREKIIYATAGLSFFKKIVLPTAIKISASPVISSNTDFSGLKYMLYMNQKLSSNTWYHLLIKHHQLEQVDRAVSITRYGFGVGVTF